MAGGAKAKGAKTDTPSTSRKRTRNVVEKDEVKDAPTTSKRAAAAKGGAGKPSSKKESAVASKKGGKSPVRKAGKEAVEVKKAPAKKAKVIEKPAKEKTPAKKARKAIKAEEPKSPEAPNTPKSAKKGGKAAKVVKEEAGPSTSKKARKEQEEASKKRELSDKEKELIARIAAERVEQTRLSATLVRKEDETSATLEVEEEAREARELVKDAIKERKKKLAANEKIMQSNAERNKKLQERINLHAEKIKAFERSIVRFTTIMESKDVQSARRGREALTLRTENRRLKRYLAHIRASLERLAQGGMTPLIERLLEMAEEDFDPVEEQQWIREERRAGRDPNRAIY